MKQFKNNHLYEYVGGGYDGCIWEYNYFLVDNEGKWVDIFHSGYNGLKNKGEALLAYNKDSTQFSVYNIYSKKDKQELAENMSYNSLGGICNFINCYYKKPILFFICSYCKEIVYPMGNEEYPSYFFDEMNYKGDGGIGIIQGALLCEDCYLHRCSKCECIVAPDDKLTFINDYDLCSYCFNEFCENVLAGKEPLTMFIDYPENQTNLFKEYSNKSKQVSILCNSSNRNEVITFLKQLGYKEGGE